MSGIGATILCPPGPTGSEDLYSFAGAGLVHNFMIAAVSDAVWMWADPIRTCRSLPTRGANSTPRNKRHTVEQKKPGRFRPGFVILFCVTLTD
jgi:hypothetical protein